MQSELLQKVFEAPGILDGILADGLSPEGPQVCDCPQGPTNVVCEGPNIRPLGAVHHEVHILGGTVRVTPQLQGRDGDVSRGSVQRNNTVS